MAGEAFNLYAASSGLIPGITYGLWLTEHHQEWILNTEPRESLINDHV